MSKITIDELALGRNGSYTITEAAGSVDLTALSAPFDGKTFPYLVVLIATAFTTLTDSAGGNSVSQSGRSGVVYPAGTILSPASSNTWATIDLATTGGAVEVYADDPSV